MKIHNCIDMSDGQVYDFSQTSDEVKDGDAFHLTGNRYAFLYKAWPTMYIGESEILHRVKAGMSVNDLEDAIDYQSTFMAIDSRFFYS